MSNIQYLAANPSSSVASHIILPAQTIGLWYQVLDKSGEKG